MEEVVGGRGTGYCYLSRVERGTHPNQGVSFTPNGVGGCWTRGSWMLDKGYHFFGGSRLHKRGSTDARRSSCWWGMGKGVGGGRVQRGTPSTFLIISKGRKGAVCSLHHYMSQSLPLQCRRCI